MLLGVPSLELDLDFESLKLMQLVDGFLVLESYVIFEGVYSEL